MSNSLLTPLALGLEEAAHRDLGAPAWAFGVFAFGALLVLLVITLIFGKGRPHG
jgi:hypothetical protein